MKIYYKDTPHDQSDSTCACDGCIKKKGMQFTLKTQKESLPWESGKEPKFNHIPYELKKYGDGYCYLDKNLKVW